MARKSRQQEQQRFLQPSAVEIQCIDSPIYHTGIYARLSRQNLRDTQVDVLSSQLHHLQDYVSSRADMELIDTYVDDGWSGLNFNRPDFTRMMEDVKSGNLNMLGLSYHSPSNDQDDGTNPLWTNSHILLLTKIPLYTGDYAYNRSRNRKYDSSHLGLQPREEWKYVPNTHPGYISKEIYRRFCAQREIRGKTLSEGKRRCAETVDQVQNPFRYLLFCGECQYALVPEKDADGNATEYICTGQHRIQAVGHLGYSITRTKVMALVIEKLRNEQAELRLLHHTLKALPTDSICAAMEDAKRRSLSDLLQQTESTARKIIRAQKDFKNGLLEPDIYHLQIEKLEMEKAIVQGCIAELQQQINELRHVLSPDPPWLCKLVALTIADELPSSLLHQLIQRIDIFADQHIAVVYTHNEEKQKLIVFLEEWEQLQREEPMHGK